MADTLSRARQLAGVARTLSLGPVGIAVAAGQTAIKKALGNPLVQGALIIAAIFLITNITNVINDPIGFFSKNKDVIEGLSSSVSQSQSLNYVSNHAIASAGTLGVTSSTPTINWTTVCDYLGADKTINDRAKQIALATQDASAPVFQVCLAAKAAAQVLAKN